MNKLEEVFSLVRTNLTTEQMKELVPMLKEEISASEKVGLTDIRANNISEAGYPIINGITIDEYELADIENNDRE